MNMETVREQLYERYIEPTRKKRKEFIGVEIELPIVNLRQEAVDFQVVHRVTEDFIRFFQFQTSGKDDEGNIFSAQDPKTGDILSYDCSYNNLELSMGKETDLNRIHQRFCRYYAYLQEQFEKQQHTLTGMGINPYRSYNRHVPIPNGRYRMLYHHLQSYSKYNLPMYFHHHPEYGMFSSASQVQLDVDYDDLAMTLDTFSKLEPVKALLFSNSVMLGEYEELLCCRDMLWENSTHGINPHNIGMFNCELENTEDVLRYIETTSIYCVERGEKYINFSPVNIMDYFQRESIQGEYYDNGKYKTIEIKPQLEDIEYLRTFNFEDLTFRGTVEFRSVCCQPISDSMTVAAFHLGLKNRLYQLNQLLKEDHVIYNQGYTAAELRKLFNQRRLPSFVDENALYELAERITDLAREGLEERGFGEETFLEPIYERIKTRENPAQTMIQSLKEGQKLEDLIRAYGTLS